MATITISLPLIPERVMTVPNDKLEELSKYYNVNVSGGMDANGDSVPATNEEKLTALADAIVTLIKGPVVHGRKHEAMQAITDISDLIQ